MGVNIFKSGGIEPHSGFSHFWTSYYLPIPRFWDWGLFVFYPLRGNKAFVFNQDKLGIGENLIKAFRLANSFR